MYLYIFSDFIIILFFYFKVKFRAAREALGKGVASVLASESVDREFESCRGHFTFVKSS